VLDGIPIKNNQIEGWHRSFSSLLSSHHQNIWKFIENLKKEQNLNVIKFEQAISGMEASQGRKNYKDAGSRLIKIVQGYGERNMVDYLRGIAHCFYLQSV
jgi:CobQ-like glutamine amidotransferase family enzyme